MASGCPRHDLFRVPAGGHGACSAGLVAGFLIWLFENGIKALQAGKIDALVHDKPLLAWAIRENSSLLELVEATFGPQNYAFVILEQSPFRKKPDIAILGAIHSAWWDQMLFQHLGARL
jgi:polar amino acid transport system substrate-binding protein